MGLLNLKPLAVNRRGFSFQKVFLKFSVALPISLMSRSFWVKKEDLRANLKTLEKRLFYFL
jgi:hypothetical protein